MGDIYTDRLEGMFGGGRKKSIWTKIASYFVEEPVKKRGRVVNLDAPLRAGAQAERERIRQMEEEYAVKLAARYGRDDENEARVEEALLALTEAAIATSLAHKKKRPGF